MPSSHKVVLVTGGSSGLGSCICAHLAAAGHKVYGTSRSATNGDVVDGIDQWQLDVTDNASVESALTELLKKEGRIDVLVNNAGIGAIGPLEDTTAAMAESAFATNFFGMHRVTRSVLPGMRKAGNGIIINISSIGAHMGLPYRGIYSASKAAVSRYSEALSMEVGPFGIHVFMVEPGDFKSNIASGRVSPPSISEAYRVSFDKTMSMLNKHMEHAPPPDAIAEKVVRLVNGSLNTPVVRVGGRMEELAVHLKYWMPAKWFRRMLGKYGE